MSGDSGNIGNIRALLTECLGTYGALPLSELNADAEELLRVRALFLKDALSAVGLFAQYDQMLQDLASVYRPTHEATEDATTKAINTIASGSESSDARDAITTSDALHDTVKNGDQAVSNLGVEADGLRAAIGQLGLILETSDTEGMSADLQGVGQGDANVGMQIDAYNALQNYIAGM